MGPDVEVKCLPVLSNKWGQLAQQNHTGVDATDAIQFIKHDKVPNNKTVTYALFACDHCSLNTVELRIQLVIGGDKLSYDNDSSTSATNLLETKIILNSIISNTYKGAGFMSLDLKDMFVQSLMASLEYMKVPCKYIESDIKEKFSLDSLIYKEYIYIKIQQGMYCLRQTAILAYQQLHNILLHNNYIQVADSMGMWKRKTRNILFNLCVHDSGVKYYRKEDVHHLIKTVSSNMN